MLLPVAERLLLLHLTTKVEGNLVLLRQVRDLQQTIGFTAAETEALDFAQEGSRFVWVEGKVPPLEVAISPPLHAAIAKVLKDESEAGRLGMQHLAICDLFLPDAADD